MLFRMPLEPKQSQFNYRWTRTQFPVAPAFAMTISKSQGQTIPENVSVLLKDPIFSHGSLYVAMSRAADPKKLKMFLPNETLPPQRKKKLKILLPNETAPPRRERYTKNVVYKDLLQQLKKNKELTTRGPPRAAAAVMTTREEEEEEENRKRRRSLQ